VARPQLGLVAVDPNLPGWRSDQIGWCLVTMQEDVAHSYKMSHLLRSIVDVTAIGASSGAVPGSFHRARPANLLRIRSGDTIGLVSCAQITCRALVGEEQARVKAGRRWRIVPDLSASCGRS
jgi:hypothetical protein